jgi:hypothetical protein
MQLLNIFTGLAMAPIAVGRGIPLLRRQQDPQCDAPAPLPLGQYINETNYHGHSGPVTVNIEVNGGGRNKTSLCFMDGESPAWSTDRIEANNS